MSALETSEDSCVRSEEATPATDAGESEEKSVTSDSGEGKKKKKADMKRPQMIVPGLFLGGLLSYDYLSDHHIEAVLNCAAELSRTPTEMAEEYGVKHYLSLDLQDVVSEELGRGMDKGIQFIIDHLDRHDRPTLVNCFEGKSRSASVVLGYLITHKGMTLKDAWKLCKSKRRIIRPNKGFWQHLMAMEMELRGSQSVTSKTIGTGPKFFECPICGKVCGTRAESLTSHVKYKHPDSTGDE